MRSTVTIWAAVSLIVGVLSVPLCAATEGDWAAQLQTAYDSSIVASAPNPPPDSSVTSENPKPAKPTISLNQAVVTEVADPIYKELNRMRKNIKSKLSAKQWRKFTELDVQMENTETQRRFQYYNNVCDSFQIDPC